MIAAVITLLAILMVVLIALLVGTILDLLIPEKESYLLYDNPEKDGP